MRQFEESIPSARWVAPAGAENYEPSRAPSVASDVLVPLGQSAVPGLIVAGLVAVVIIGSEAHLVWQKWVLVLGVPFLSLTLVLYFWRLGWASETIYKVEQIIGTDLSGDGRVGRPHAMSVNQGTGRKADITRRTRDAIVRFVLAAYESSNGVRALRSKHFTDDEIVYYRDILMREDVGVAAWKNPRDHNAGWVLVKSKEDALKAISKLEWLE